MSKLNHPLEKFIQTISYKRVEFDVVERPDVLWVGSLDYAKGNTGESDIDATFQRMLSLKGIPRNDVLDTDYGAALSINYRSNDKPCGLMFGKETYSDKQDERFELFTQPGGLWLRLTINEENDIALLGQKNDGSHLYFHFLNTAAEENGYKQNPDVDVAVNYDYHPAGDRDDTCPNYVYIPIIKV